MEKYLGKNVKELHWFKDSKIDFGNYYAATDWCVQNGFGYGSMCMKLPIAIIKGEYNLPQKWRNMSYIQRNSVSGVILSDDFRNGIVKILIF